MRFWRGVLSRCFPETFESIEKFILAREITIILLKCILQMERITIQGKKVWIIHKWLQSISVPRITHPEGENVVVGVCPVVGEPQHIDLSPFP